MDIQNIRANENLENTIDTNIYEEAMDLILPGLQIFVRDVNLTPDLISKYRVGDIIRVKHFTDASCRIQGMVTNTRYQILSNHMADFREFEEGTNWGLFVGQTNSRFKVIDVFEKNGKTLISLLHLPSDYHWRVFIDSTIKFDGTDLSLMARERFLNKFETTPIKELSKSDWLSRCEIPLGINPDGSMVPVEIIPGERWYEIDRQSFRDIFDNVIYLKSSKLLKQFAGIDEFKEILRKVEGFICYGYIDLKTGLTLEILDFAYVKDDKVETIPLPDISIKIRIGNVKDEKYFTLMDTPFNVLKYDHQIKEILKNYDVEPSISKMRHVTGLDEFRNFENPDDVYVMLTSEKYNPEIVWVKCIDMKEKYLVGRLLNEPNNDMQVHEGELLAFVPFEHEGEEFLIRIFPEKIK